MTRMARAYVRFEKNPSSVRYAAAAIISTIAVLVVAGAVLIQLTLTESLMRIEAALAAAHERLERIERSAE